MTDIVLVPILAEIPAEGFGPAAFYQAIGGLAQMAGNPDPVFYLAYRIVRRLDDGDVVISQGAATESLLDVFPELEDLYALRACWISGAPVDAFKVGQFVMGLTDAQAYDAKVASEFFRIQPVEADALFVDIIKAIAISGPAQPGLAAGIEVLAGWIEKQDNRWAGEAASAIEAHDLVVFDMSGN